MTMTSLSQTALSRAGDPQVQPVRMQGDGCIALVDVDLFDADGSVAMRGHAVCLRRSAQVA